MFLGQNPVDHVLSDEPLDTHGADIVRRRARSLHLFNYSRTKALKGCRAAIEPLDLCVDGHGQVNTPVPEIVPSAAYLTYFSYPSHRDQTAIRSVNPEIIRVFTNS